MDYNLLLSSFNTRLLAPTSVERKHTPYNLLEILRWTPLDSSFIRLTVAVKYPLSWESFAIAIMAAPVPAYTGTVEKQKLKHVIIGWIDPTISDGGFDIDIIGQAFDNAGIHGYNDLVMLQPDDIRNWMLAEHTSQSWRHTSSLLLSPSIIWCHKRLNVCLILKQWL